MTKVYVVIRGCYSDSHVDGVFSTLELAKAHYPGEIWDDREDARWPTWTNQKDWGSALEIMLEDLDPVRVAPGGAEIKEG